VRPRPEQLYDYREYPILYVDDEPENLRIFELTFRRDFAILTASNGEEGLEVLSRQPVALVLSDHRMPNMTGAEFLARVAELDPKTVRIMVTAYGDVETLQHAINDGHIYSYIPKPWSPDDVKGTLRRGIEVYALDREREQLLRELALLNRVSSSLAQELDLDRLLRLLLGTMHEEMGYDAVAALFFEPDGSLVWGRLGPGNEDVDPQLRDLRITSESAPRFLADLQRGKQRILHVEEALDYEGPVRRWVTEVAAEEILVSPLHGKDGVIGALVVDNRRGGARFYADDRTLIEGLSNQAAIAIENARLVDDLRRSREQVRRADRLGTLGTLAAGLAHEINNPLVSIHTFLSMAPAKRLENDAEFWGSYYDLACSEVARIRGLVDTMRRLGSGSGGTMPRQTVEVGALVDEVVTLLRREAELGHVELTVECEESVPKLIAVRDQIHQVLLNLLLNAIAATPEGGGVAVRVTSPGESQGVQIDVRDSGPGIPPEHLDQIFDPFFTTKDPDEGSGLGLMVCHRIVTDHGGTIEVRSHAGQGATFTVRLPESAPEVGAGASA
jgi:signal transduction histidine kinase/FixJ family two-component response regulator